MRLKKGKKCIKNSLNLGEIWGIKIFSRGRTRVLKLAEEWIGGKGKGVHFVVTVNPEHLMAAVRDKSYHRVLEKTDLNVADGIGIVWAKATNNNFQFSNPNFQRIRKILTGLRVGWEILQGKYGGRVAAGSDLMKDLIEMAGARGWRVFLLGGWEDRAERAAKNFQFSNLNLRIEACQGRPEISEEEVWQRIEKFRPKILLVAYGMVKQEKWIVQNLEKLEKAGVRWVMGVGRSFDYYSGDLKRAPEWMRRAGLEWLYSLYKEPKRWRRQLALPRFVVKVLKSESPKV